MWICMQVCSSSFWTHQVHPDITACAERWGAHSRLWLRSWASGAEGPWSPWLVQAGAGWVPAETPSSHRAIRKQMDLSVCLYLHYDLMSLLQQHHTFYPLELQHHVISEQFLCIILWNSSRTVHYQQRSWSTMQDTGCYWRHASAQVCCLPSSLVLSQSGFFNGWCWAVTYGRIWIMLLSVYCFWLW